MNDITLEKLSDQKWRLNNLYEIRDRNGKVVPFRLNAIQSKLLEASRSRNLILKARQSGVSAFITAFILDESISTPDNTAHIVISKNKDMPWNLRTHLENMMVALPEDLRKDSIQQISLHEASIGFPNGSRITVSTKSPRVPTGVLYIQDPENYGPEMHYAISIADTVFIDCTNDFGRTVKAFSATENVDKRDKKRFKLHFFAWWDNPDNVLNAQETQLDEEDAKYFEKVERKCGITLSEQQKWWYVTFLRSVFCGDRSYMRQEYPSYWKEADEV